MRIGFDAATQAWIKAWALILLASAAVAVALVIGALWVMSGFHGLGVSLTVLIALLLGTLGTVAMSVVLMGLVFYSDASRHDAEVQDLSVRSDQPQHRAGDRNGREF